MGNVGIDLRHTRTGCVADDERAADPRCLHTAARLLSTHTRRSVAYTKNQDKTGGSGSAKRQSGDETREHLSYSVIGNGTIGRRGWMR